MRVSLHVIFMSSEYSLYFVFIQFFFRCSLWTEAFVNRRDRENYTKKKRKTRQPNGICILLDEIPVATSYWIFLSNNENKTNLKTFTSLKLLYVRQSPKLIQFSVVMYSDFMYVKLNSTFIRTNTNMHHRQRNNAHIRLSGKKNK